MTQVRNIIFSLFALVCCASVIGGWIVDKAGIHERPVASYLEGRLYQTFPDITRDALAEGQFQNQFEAYLADHVPQRENVMLVSASMQRAAIEVANGVFGYDLYPTYYSSKFYCWPDEDAFIEVRKSITEDEKQAAIGIAEGLSRLAEQTPRIRWLLYMPDRLMFSSAAPQFELSSRAIDYEQVHDVLEGSLSDKITFINGARIQRDVLIQDYFRTDHHWTVAGAMKGYEAIMAELGIAPITYSFKTIEPGEMYGSSTRAGRCMYYSDELVDVDYQASDLQLTLAGEPIDASYLCKSFSEEGFQKGAKYDAFYGRYFHDSTDGVLEIHNAEASEGSLLLLGDSFTFCLDRIFAEHYQTVYCVDPRKYRAGIDTFIQEHDDIEAALFLANPESMLLASMAAGFALQ